MSRLRELIDELCPDGVGFKKLGCFCECFSGATPKKSNSTYWEDGTIPWMSSGEVHQHVVTHVNGRITQAGYDSCSTRMVPAGTVVVALAGQGKTRGTVAITDIELCTNQSIGAILCDETVDSKYLYYYLSAQYDYLRRISSGEGTRGGLNMPLLRNLDIPVPPVEVQREVVRILDSFQELDDALTAEIEAREEQYSLLSERLLSQEYLEAAAGVTIVQKPLKEIALVGSSKRVLKRDLVDSGIPFFRGTEVGLLSEGNPIDPQLFLTEETYASVVSASGRPLVGDLLLPSVNEAGKVWMVDTDDAFYLKDARVLWVHTGSAKEEVDCRYMRYALSKSLVDNYRLLASGAQFAELKISSLETAPILLPPVDVQSMVADKLDDARALLQDRTIGLPAERDARRKQFEHYRDKLLSFPVKEA